MCFFCLKTTTIAAAGAAAPPPPPTPHRVVNVFLLPRSQDEEKEWDGIINWSTVVRSGWWVSCMAQKRRQPLAIWHESEIGQGFISCNANHPFPVFFCWVVRLIPNESSQEVLPTQPPFQAMDYDPQAGRWRNKSSRLKFESSGFWVVWYVFGQKKTVTMMISKKNVATTNKYMTTVLGEPCGNGLSWEKFPRDTRPESRIRSLSNAGNNKKIFQKKKKSWVGLVWEDKNGSLQFKICEAWLDVIEKNRIKQSERGDWSNGLFFP